MVPIVPSCISVAALAPTGGGHGTESAEQQMETTARTYFERVNKGDVEGILALFADDAQLINPMTDEEGIRGKAALRAAY